MIKNTYDLNSVKDEYFKREQQALKKMYPDVDTSDKFILFVESEFWIPYLTQYIDATVEFIYEDDIKTYKTKIRKPYPNKIISTISMVNGAKVCDLGIPIIFNSYEDLNKLKHLLIKWKIDLINDEEIREKYYVQVLYDLDFNYIEGKRVYSIFTKDTILQSYSDKETLNKYIDEFDKVMMIKNSSKDNFSIKYFKDIPSDENVIKEELIVSIKENIDTSDLDNYESITIFSYFSKEVLNPNTIAENLQHI